MKRRPLATVCLVLCLFLLTGTLLDTKSPSLFREWEGEPVTITGRVYLKEETEKQNTKQTILYLKLHSATAHGKEQALPEKETCRAICYLKEGQQEPEMGSIIRAEGTLRCFAKATNPGQFDAESYYRILKLSFQLNQTEIQQKTDSYYMFGENLYRFRKKCARIFDEVLPEKEASLMKTILLGEKRSLDAEIKTLYQRNGIAHILAISGLHISLLGITLYRLLKRMGVPLLFRLGLPTGVVILYVCMTGFSVSAVRAMIMFVIHMAALACKRTYDLLTAAALAAILLLLEQPLYWYHSGFLFSFGCIVAIGLMVPAMTWAKKMPEGIRLRILSGLALTLSCLPLQLWFFYETPIFSAFLNLLVIPLMSFLVPGGLILLFFGAMKGAAAGVMIKLMGFLVTGILFLYEKACLLLEMLPVHSFISGRPKAWQVAGYLLTLGVILFMKRKWSLLPRWLLLLSGVLLLVFPLPQKTAVTFLDVGQGDCIHIQSESGYHYLVDGGSSDVSRVGQYRILPYLKYKGVNSLEAVFVTHPDEDHCNGILELLALAKEEGIVVKRLYLPDIWEASKTEAYDELVQAAGEAGVSVEYLAKGMCLVEGKHEADSIQDEKKEAAGRTVNAMEGLTFLCLHPEEGYATENENTYSLVLLMQYGDVEVLLTGDVGEEGESALLLTLQEYGIKEVEVLKVAHHGSRYSTTEAFLMQIRPKLAVISCGRNNSYGHPHEETLERLSNVGSLIFATPESGAVTVEIGEEVIVYDYRE